MPQIIPIKDLKNTAEISSMCHQNNEPIFITKNGYGDMVIMSMEAYEREMYLLDVERKLKEAQADVAAGRVEDAKESLQRIRQE